VGGGKALRRLTRPSISRQTACTRVRRALTDEIWSSSLSSPATPARSPSAPQPPSAPLSPSAPQRNAAAKRSSQTQQAIAAGSSPSGACRPLRQVVCAPRRLRLLALLAPVRIDAPATTLRPRGTGSVGDSVGEGRSRPPPGPSQRGQGVREGEGKGRPGRLTAYSHSDSPFTPASPPRVRVRERACVYSRRADAGVYAGGEQRYAAGQQRCKLHTP